MPRVIATFITLSVVCVFMGAAPFQANRWSAVAQADPDIGENSYVVDFPEEFGGQTVEMSIVSGSYKIEFLTNNKRAKLLEWNQEVSPIEIMGMSTGPIIISLEPDTETRGYYDPDGGPDRKGTVELQAIFRIEFDDTELQQIGLTSPFIMPALETGAINADGVLELTADGQGELLGLPLLFSCVATTKLKSIEFLPDVDLTGPQTE